MADRIPMTRAGYNKIKAELDELQHEKLPEAEKRIGAARAEVLEHGRLLLHAAASEIEAQVDLEQQLAALAPGQHRALVQDDQLAPRRRVPALAVEFTHLGRRELVSPGRQVVEDRGLADARGSQQAVCLAGFQ